MALSLLDFTNQTASPLKRGIVHEITNESVFLRRLHFVPVNGFAYTYNRQKTLGGIAFRGLNGPTTNDTGLVTLRRTLALSSARSAPPPASQPAGLPVRPTPSRPG